MHHDTPSPPGTLQMVYGIALAAAGIGIFVRFDQVVPPKLNQFQTFADAMWFIRICFYLMGIILIGGGARKIIHYFKARRSVSGGKPVEPTDG